MILNQAILTGVNQPPSKFAGCFLKQGSVLKSWKKRYFVLNKGVLSYYEKNFESVPNQSKEQLNKASKLYLKGSISLQNYEISTTIKDSQTLAAKDLVVSAQTSHSIFPSLRRSLKLSSESDQISSNIIALVPTSGNKNLRELRLKLQDKDSDNQYSLTQWVDVLKQHIQYAIKLATPMPVITAVGKATHRYDPNSEFPRDGLKLSVLRDFIDMCGGREEFAGITTEQVNNHSLHVIIVLVVWYLNHAISIRFECCSYLLLYLALTGV
jgi:hypothetical protein